MVNGKFSEGIVNSCSLNMDCTSSSLHSVAIVKQKGSKIFTAQAPFQGTEPKPISVATVFLLTNVASPSPTTLLPPFSPSTCRSPPRSKLSAIVCVLLFSFDVPSMPSFAAFASNAIDLFRRLAFCLGGRGSLARESEGDVAGEVWMVATSS